MIYIVRFNDIEFQIVLNWFPEVFDVIKCSRGEFMITEMQEKDGFEVLIVVRHQQIEL